MVKCMNNGCNNELAGRQRTFCSDKCRKAQSRTESRTNETRTQSRTLVDTPGQEHPINYEGRRKDYELLESWADGKGTEYQRRLGELARHYRPLDFIVTSYLGIA